MWDKIILTDEGLWTCHTWFNACTSSAWLHRTTSMSRCTHVLNNSMCAAGRAAAPVTAWQHSSGQEGLYFTKIWLSSITEKLKSSQISVSTSYVLRSLPKFSTSNEQSQRGHCCQLSPHYSAECHISPFFTSVLHQHSTKTVSKTRTQKVRKMDFVVLLPRVISRTTFHILMFYFILKIQIFFPLCVSQGRPPRFYSKNYWNTDSPRNFMECTHCYSPF